MANRWTKFLKYDQKCDLVICLSHLGYKYNNDKISDIVLASMTQDIDLIIGGHTHTFLSAPETVKNAGGGITTINQVGFGGINLGRIDYVFNRVKGKKLRKDSKAIIVK